MELENIELTTDLDLSKIKATEAALIEEPTIKQVEPPQPFLFDMPPEMPIIEELTPQQRILKRQLINQINMYKLKFKKHLGTDYDKINVESMNLRQLDDLTVELGYVVGIGSSTSQMSNMIYNGVGIMEKLLPRVGLKTEGLSQLVARDPGFNDTIEEISIKHSKALFVEPEKRLFMHLAGAIYMTHSINSMKDGIKTKLDSENIDEKLKEKSQDL